MTNRLKHDSEWMNRVLTYLNITAGPPTLELLGNLIHAFVRHVPWESAFRIVRRSRCSALDSCPRWPEEFWREHLNAGSGGTCFETNYAFYFLLRAMAYDCYLTINDMGQSIGCHTAIIVIIDNKKWLVDAGFPLYAVLPLNPFGDVYVPSPILHYVVRAEGSNRYQIERRPHPKSYAFTLLDQPVSEVQYRAATAADYGPHGHFLDRVIIHKVINEVLWRFNSDERPYRLENFENGRRGEELIDRNAAAALALKFGMDEDVLRLALELTRD